MKWIPYGNNIVGILVRSGCYSKILYNKWLKRQTFLRVLEAGESIIKMHTDSILDDSFYSLQMAAFSLYLHMLTWLKEEALGSLPLHVSSIIPWWSSTLKTSPKPESFPKALPLMLSLWRLGLQHMYFGWEISINPLHLVHGLFCFIWFYLSSLPSSVFLLVHSEHLGLMSLLKC